MDPHLVCPICSATFDTPTTLPCGHSVCSVHLDDSVTRADVCPIPDCDSPNPFPARLDVTLNKVIEICKRHRRTFNRIEHDEYRVGGLSDDDDDDDGHDDCGNDALSISPPRKRRRVDDGVCDDAIVPQRYTSATQRTSRHDAPLLPDSAPRSSFEKELQAELSCEICLQLLHMPITTPCQHTFCQKCLDRSLDHSDKCPVCRQALPGYSFFEKHSVNRTLHAIILYVYPTLHADRAAIIEAEEHDARLNTPILLCHLSFPGMPVLLHFFEPRYRLMLRRCLMSPNPCFGMVMPSRHTGQSDSLSASEYGTMLEIQQVQMLPGGRSMVRTWGSYRFRIMERGLLDGYMVGRIERVDDVEEEDVLAPRTEDLIDSCLLFIEYLRHGTAPWVVRRLSDTCGPMPPPDSNLAEFTFWLGMVLPIDEAEKYKLMPIKSARMRLRMCVWWIEGLRANWWFSSGCTIL
ncbi:hypothetical protein FISHEDRAFT_41822 [Fistulina hepatica ATCC 64428]|nr:hypothetical protein FISHEDRAFT_41822 [Fistulina hepatica ATCC 64428]